MRKAVPDKPAGLMSYIKADYPFHKVGIDLLGPFPETPKPKKYVIVAVDYITKWTETDSLPNGTAEEAAQFFVRNIVLRHGHHGPRKMFFNRLHPECSIFWMLPTIKQRVIGRKQMDFARDSIKPWQT